MSCNKLPKREASASSTKRNAREDLKKETTGEILDLLTEEDFMQSCLRLPSSTASCAASSTTTAVTISIFAGQLAVCTMGFLQIVYSIPEKRRMSSMRVLSHVTTPKQKHLHSSGMNLDDLTVW